MLRGLRCMSPKGLLRLLYAKSIKKNRPTKVANIKKKFLSTGMPILVDRTCKKLLLSIEMGFLVDRRQKMMCAPFIGRFNFRFDYADVALSRRSSPCAELRSLLRTAGWRICQRWCLTSCILARFSLML